MTDTRERKDAFLKVRLTAGEHEAFVKFCASAGLTPSEAMRRLVRGVAFFGPTFDGDARKEIVALTRQVRAVGVNLNQAVRHMNAGHVVTGEDVREWLAATREVITELVGLYRSLCGRVQARGAKVVIEGEP